MLSKICQSTLKVLYRRKTTHSLPVITLTSTQNFTDNQMSFLMVLAREIGHINDLSQVMFTLQICFLVIKNYQTTLEVLYRRQTSETTVYFK